MNCVNIPNQIASAESHGSLLHNIIWGVMNCLEGHKVIIMYY